MHVFVAFHRPGTELTALWKAVGEVLGSQAGDVRMIVIRTTSQRHTLPILLHKSSRTNALLVTVLVLGTWTVWLRILASSRTLLTAILLVLPANLFSGAVLGFVALSIAGSHETGGASTSLAAVLGAHHADSDSWTLGLTALVQAITHGLVPRASVCWGGC